MARAPNHRPGHDAAASVLVALVQASSRVYAAVFLIQMTVRAKFFKNGDSQAVRLPKDCRFLEGSTRSSCGAKASASCSSRSTRGRTTSSAASGRGGERSRARSRITGSRRAIPSVTEVLAYLLDTDTVSFIIRGQGPAASRLTAHQPSEVCMSALTLAELRFGAERRRSRRLQAIIDTFARSIQLMPVDDACAAAYGRIQASLESKGTPIARIDTLIVAHAFALDLTLISNNQKHFSKFRGLKIANWS